jgi:hypothetical protein
MVMKKTEITIEDAKRIAQEIMMKMCSHKYLNLTWVDSKSYKSLMNEGWHMYKISNYHSTKHFNWNQDHDYCERQYDCYSIIENDECPKFEEVKSFAKSLVTEYLDKFGIVVEIEIDGIKDYVSLHVDVQI